MKHTMIILLIILNDIKLMCEIFQLNNQFQIKKQNHKIMYPHSHLNPYNFLVFYRNEKLY